MPIIEINMLEGRDTETKRALIREVTDAVERTLGVPRASIRILVRDVAPAHWGVGGETKEA